MISIHRLRYNRYSSEDFNLCCELAFDSDSGATSTYLSREAVASETYRGDIQRTSSYKYTEVLEATVTFVDKNFGDFDLNRQRKILKWLTSKDTPSFLTIYHDDSEAISYEILGNWTQCDTYRLGNGRVVGFQCTFTSISPFAFSPLITKTDLDFKDNKITINLETDDPQNAVYPRITIQQAAVQDNEPLDKPLIVNINHVPTTEERIPGTIYFYNGTYYWLGGSGSSNSSGIQTTSVAIKNIHTDEDDNKKTFKTVVKYNTAGERIILDGANKIVSSSDTRIFGDNFDFNWLPLYEGKNELSFEGNCKVTIEYRTPIKCGAF